MKVELPPQYKLVKYTMKKIWESKDKYPGLFFWNCDAVTEIDNLEGLALIRKVVDVDTGVDSELVCFFHDDDGETRVSDAELLHRNMMKMEKHEIGEFFKVNGEHYAYPHE